MLNLAQELVTSGLGPDRQPTARRRTGVGPERVSNARSEPSGEDGTADYLALLERLSPKQRAFVRELEVDGNGTKAATRAGYSPSNAASQASHLSRNSKVAAVLAFRARLKTRVSLLRAERTIRELGRIAFSNILDVVAWGPDGMTLKGSTEITEEAASSIADVSIRITKRRGTCRDRERTSSKL